MNFTLKLTLSFLFIACFAGFAMAHGTDERLDIASFASNPDAYAGRIVAVEARVIAIDASGKRLELFDSPSRTRISVQLTQLPKAERTVLMQSDVRKVVVRGEVSMVQGRMTIQAQSVQALTSDCESGK
jgi:hypothetical protein